MAETQNISPRLGPRESGAQLRGFKDVQSESQKSASYFL